MSSPQLTRCREARAWTKRLGQQNVIIIESLRKKKKFAEIKSTPIMGFYQFHPIPSKVRSLQLAPGQLSARSPWLKPGDGNWPGSVANTCNDLLKLFLAGTALMLSHMKRRETSHQFVLSLFSTIVAYSCHSIRISQACGKLSWKLAPICSEDNWASMSQSLHGATFDENTMYMGPNSIAHVSFIVPCTFTCSII